MNRLFIVTLHVLVILSFVDEAFAQAWTKETGEAYLKLSGAYFDSDRVYDVHGNLEEPDFTYSHEAVRLYGELGVASRLAAFFSVPVVHATNYINERISIDRWGAGDLTLGLQGRLWSEGRCTSSIRVGADVPLYGELLTAGGAVTSANPEGSEEEQFEPAMGDGSIDVAPLLAYGCSTSDVPVWVSAAVGPRFRFRGFGDALDWSFGAGAFLVPGGLAVTTRMAGSQRFSSPRDRPTASYATAGAGLITWFSDTLALGGGFSYILDGAYVARGWELSLGLSWDGRIFR